MKTVPAKRRGERADRRQQSERGLVAVEFVVVFPILFLMLVGVVEFGRYYNASISVTHAAREAVRIVALDNAASASATATTAAAPVVVSVGSVVTCPITGAPSNASVTVTNTFSFSYLFGAASFPIARKAVMRCGG
jgi:Flp pilus assembly protein TadG